MPIVSRQLSLNSTLGTFTGGYATTNHVRLSDTRMVIVNNITGVSPDFFTRTFTIVDMSQGLDTDLDDPYIVRTVGYKDKEAFQGNGVSIVRLSETRFVVSEPRSTGTVKLEIFEVSDTTITRVLNQNILTSTGMINNAVTASHVLIPLSPTAFIQTSLVSNAVNYTVYRFTPAVVGPPAVAASITLVRTFADTETTGGYDITWQAIPGTTQVLIVNRYVTQFYYAYQGYCWIVDEQGAAVRPRFTVDSEPAFLGPDRMVVSRWGKQNYFKKDGTSDGRSFSLNYTGSTDDDNLYRPVIVPVSNDYHLQLRREFFQDLDTAVFMKVVRRDDSNFHTSSDWSTSQWYGKVIYSSLTTQKFALPFDKRVPTLTGNNRLFWTGLYNGTYRTNVLVPTSTPPVNPPTGPDPVPQPMRAATTRFTFDSGKPSKMSFTGDAPRFLQYSDNTIGTTGVLATPTHVNNANFYTYLTFQVPAGLTKGVMRYFAQNESGYDYVNVNVDGRQVVQATGNMGDFTEVSFSVSGGTTINMTIYFRTDGSVASGIAAMYISMIEFRPQ